MVRDLMAGPFRRQRVSALAGIQVGRSTQHAGHTNQCHCTIQRVSFRSLHDPPPSIRCVRGSKCTMKTSVRERRSVVDGKPSRVEHFEEMIRKKTRTADPPSTAGYAGPRRAMGPVYRVAAGHAPAAIMLSLAERAPVLSVGSSLRTARSWRQVFAYRAPAVSHCTLQFLPLTVTRRRCPALSSRSLIPVSRD